jgi:hypothetical protein
VRFYAYGGTSYRERSRIGSWPAIPAGTLEDLYGLRSENARRRAREYGLKDGGISFGCGLLENHPILIIRHHQNTALRGGYAYTALIDPGENVWRRFAFNAAALCHSLLNASALRAALLENPESCTEPSLGQLFSGLEPAGLPPAADRSGFGEIFFAGLLSGSAVALNPHHCSGLDTSSVGRIASGLSLLPQFLRVGGGWMAGGGLKAGAVLGTRIVFDEEDEASKLNDDLFHRASAASKSWIGMSSRPEYAATLQPLNDSLVHQWPQAAARIVDDVVSLHRFHSSKLNDEEFGNLVRSCESATDLF